MDFKNSASTHTATSEANFLIGIADSDLNEIIGIVDTATATASSAAISKWLW